MDHPAHEVYLIMRGDSFFSAYTDEEIFALIYEEERYEKGVQRITSAIIFAVIIGLLILAHS